MNGNANKNKALGMPYGTATARLRKALLFDAITRLGECNCYRCGKPIELLKDFSIDHMKSWLFSENPIEFFFDLSNISYSHLSCNTAAGVRTQKKFKDKVERAREVSRRRRADPEQYAREHQGRINRRAAGKKW